MRFLAFLFLWLLSPSVFASDWLKLTDDLSGNIHYVDMDTVKLVEPHVIKVWLKILNKSKRKYGNQLVWYDMVSFLFDCESNKHKVTRHIIYNTSGNILKDLTYFDGFLTPAYEQQIMHPNPNQPLTKIPVVPDPSKAKGPVYIYGWRENPPDSLTGGLQAALCSNFGTISSSLGE